MTKQEQIDRLKAACTEHKNIIARLRLDTKRHKTTLEYNLNDAKTQKIFAAKDLEKMQIERERAISTCMKWQKSYAAARAEITYLCDRIIEVKVEAERNRCKCNE